MIFAHFRQDEQDHYFVGPCLDDIFRHVDALPKEAAMTRHDFVKTLTLEEVRKMGFRCLRKTQDLVWAKKAVIDLGPLRLVQSLPQPTRQSTHA